MYRFTKTISVAPDKNKTPQKKKPDGVKEITANTFLFFLLHALCCKIWAVLRIVSVSLLVDMLTQCFEFAVWRRQRICKCWQACRTQFCQRVGARRLKTSREKNLSGVTALKSQHPAGAAQQLVGALHAPPPSQASSTREGKAEKEQHGASSKAN